MVPEEWRSSLRCAAWARAEYDRFNSVAAAAPGQQRSGIAPAQDECGCGMINGEHQLLRDTVLWFTAISARRNAESQLPVCRLSETLSDYAVVTGPQLTVFRVKKADAATISPNQVTRQPVDLWPEGPLYPARADTAGIFKE